MLPEEDTVEPCDVALSRRSFRLVEVRGAMIVISVELSTNPIVTCHITHIEGHVG